MIIDKKVIAITSNSYWNIVNYRLDLLLFFKEYYKIVLIVPLNHEHDHELIKLYDVDIKHIDLNKYSLSIFKNILLLFSYLRILSKLKPNYLFTFTAKPNIIASFASMLLRIPTINNVTGLGMGFEKEGFLKFFLINLYRFSFYKSKMIFFQNNEDLHYFRYKKIVSIDFSDLLPGSGINLNLFSYSSYPRYPDSAFKFLMATRLIWSKGIREYFEAANYVNKIYPDVEFCLLGIFEDLNPQSVKLCDIEKLKKTSSVNFLSGVSDITSYISKSSCVVLPSYYPEGTPRFLLEAAAMGRPVITTNLKGCRDVIDDNVTGLLCLPNSVSDLADKMIKMINYNFDQREAMGFKARKKMEKEFDVALVCQKYMDVIKIIE